MIAIEKHKIIVFLQNEHNPDVTSKSGFTPLHIASHYGNQQIANLLIQKGADVNYAAKHNITPLHVAAKWGKTNMVAVLLENGAAIDSKTRDGLTPLHCAARSGHEQVVDMLLERGAPISSKTKVRKQHFDLSYTIYCFSLIYLILPSFQIILVRNINILLSKLFKIISTLILRLYCRRKSNDFYVILGIYYPSFFIIPPHKVII